jgi:uncharacterized protein DUF6353
MTLATIARRAAKFAGDNSPTILTSIGVVGAITTAYLAGKASWEASDIIRLKEADDLERNELIVDPREIMIDRLKLVWRLYIPAVTMGATTVVCIIGANRIGSRRAASAAAAFSIGEKAFEEYKAKVVEKIGERKNEQIHDEIAQDRVDETYFEGIKMVGLDKGEICYDMFGGQYFLSTVEDMRSAENSLNATILHNGYASLADFYRLLGIDVPVFSESIGWNSDQLIELRISTTLIHEIKPCLTISFRHDPKPDYGRFH